LKFFNVIFYFDKLSQEWRRKVRFAFERDEVLDLFRETVDQIVAERMERECRMESVDEHHEEVRFELKINS
jgi:hypothetical protein